MAKSKSQPRPAGASERAARPLPRWGESRRARWRTIFLLGLNLAMIAHFIHWRIAGRTVSPIEPSESMQTLQRGAINAGFIFFALAILATMIFGRFVCGWGCHILALQDFCGWLMKKVGITPRPFRSRLLLFVPLLAALYMFVWPTFHRAFLSGESGPVIPGFSNHIITSDFWSTFPTPPVAIPFLLICGFVIVYFLGAKGFCSYACPYGGFFGLADKIAPGRIRVTDACNQCGHCTSVCTSNVVVNQEVKHFGMVVDPGCMKCMDCVSVCPTDALYFGWGKPALFAAPKSKPPPPRYSLSWPEELAAALIFLGSFLAIRGVYGLVPFLMALGAAAVVTFVALKSWQLLRRDTVMFHQFILRSDGKLRRAGWWFHAFAVLALGFTLQSAVVRYHEFRGDNAFQTLRVPDELALAQPNPAMWLSPEDRVAIAEGKRHFAIAQRAGLVKNGEALAKLGWFDYLSGDASRAIDLLADAAEHERGQSKALSFYYRGAIENRLGRYEDAQTDLERALAERDDLLLARQELGESLWQLDRKQEAIATWNGAVRRAPHLPLVHSFLAGAYHSLGDEANASMHQQRAEQDTPRMAAYHWMLGLRLKNLGMLDLAAIQFSRATQLDPSFRRFQK